MLWARICRESTGSFSSYKLPYRMEVIEIEDYLKKNLPGWSLVMASVEHPELPT